MKKIMIALAGIMLMTMTSCNESQPAATDAQQEEVKVYDPAKMLVRLSVIEVYPEYLDEYLAAAATVGGRVGKERTRCYLHLSLSLEERQVPDPHPGDLS